MVLVLSSHSYTCFREAKVTADSPLKMRDWMAFVTRLVHGCAGIHAINPHPAGTDVGKSASAGWRTCAGITSADADGCFEREIPIPAGADAQVPAGISLKRYVFDLKRVFRANLSRRSPHPWVPLIRG